MSRITKRKNLMKLKKIRYHTMNSWNNSTAPAYNLKVYNVIPKELQNKVFELLECDDFYFEINQLLNDFSIEHNYSFQAGFNGRSGGYLVLYKGGYKSKILYPESEFNNPSYNNRVYEDGHGWKNKEEAKKSGLLNKTIKKVFCYAGKGIDDNEVSKEVLKSFEKLANNIVNYTINLAKESEVKEEEYAVIKTRKIIV